MMNLGLPAVQNLLGQPDPPKTPWQKAQAAIKAYTRPIDDAVEPFLDKCHPWASTLAFCMIVGKAAGPFALNVFVVGFMIGSWMTIITFVPPFMRSFTASLGYLYAAAALGAVMGTLMCRTFLGFWLLPLAIASNLRASGHSGTLCMLVAAVFVSVWGYFKFRGVPLEERAIQFIAAQNASANVIPPGNKAVPILKK